MGELKYSQLADGAGYLYRATLAMAQGNINQADDFIKIAEKQTQKKFTFSKADGNRLTAEKILDEYRKIMIECEKKFTLQ